MTFPPMAYRFPRSWLFLLALTLSISSVACGNSPIAPGAAIAITSVSPANGSTFGGTTVTISGSGFSAGVAVSIGGVPATQVAVVTAQSVRATTGAHAAGPADVVVSLAGRQAMLAGAFTFVAPATGSNAPPDVSALVAQGTRPMQPANMADLGESIAVSASVTDAETDPSQLTYEWSSTMGSFSSSGSQVIWQAPGALAQTPVDATLTLTVIEHYTEADAQGLPVAKENRVTRTATVSVHDSAREVADLARQFLVLFSQSSVPPDQVLAGFSSDCGNGPSDERSDVEKNRCRVHHRRLPGRHAERADLRFRRVVLLAARGPPRRRLHRRAGALGEHGEVDGALLSGPGPGCRARRAHGHRRARLRDRRLRAGRLAPLPQRFRRHAVVARAPMRRESRRAR